mmetsp:Transcript_3265/g.5063  ORF Transcript_3265/g.5063 Transcript_3265/m.5063 type:complete len:442 (-) Transcript_3265:78-1403(-)|eukprot:CAMPEP_0171458136 /NCGR_PEP_ID=MMETSP0945-20130129/3937_1 /TAXON_ID=109269 /ORGANISM="Vaucheria litorea, Strain CCMP2940" /LENGTH=441 /DNA_ID=CAMNT_0011983887 /DNA_START=55 /DNA_END=1380 /DNA_ORIENTATION=+
MFPSKLAICLIYLNFDAVNGLSYGSNNEVLVLSDSFDKFDFDLWQHEITAGGAHGDIKEFQYFTNNRTNSYIKDGALYIQPTLTSEIYTSDGVLGKVPSTLNLWGSHPGDLCTSNSNFGCVRSSDIYAREILPPVQSASIRTSKTFSFRYGRLEIVAKLPKGDWLKPIISLLPEQNAYGNWPASGEIDLVESRGNDLSYSPGGSNSITSEFIWGPQDKQFGWYSTKEFFSLPEGGSFSDDYHTFGLYWDKDVMYTYVDSDSNSLAKIYFNETAGPLAKKSYENPNISSPWTGGSNAAPFDERFYVKIALAVGGVDGYFPDGIGNKPWLDSSMIAVNQFNFNLNKWYPTWNGTESALKVSSVKVWQVPEMTKAESNTKMYYKSNDNMAVVQSANVGTNCPYISPDGSTYTVVVISGAIGICIGIVIATLAYTSKHSSAYYQL